MSKRIANMGVFAALALIFGYIEMLIPVRLPIPGVKLGIANIVTVAALYLLSEREAVAISLFRIFISALLFGSAMSLAYSLAGGVLSLAGMLLFKRADDISVVGVSVAGAVLHNIGQLAMALLLLRSQVMVSYLPVLLVAGVATGLLIGVVSRRTVTVLQRVGHSRDSEG